LTSEIRRRTKGDVTMRSQLFIFDSGACAAEQVSKNAVRVTRDVSDSPPQRTQWTQRKTLHHGGKEERRDRRNKAGRRDAAKRRQSSEEDPDYESARVNDVTRNLDPLRSMRRPATPAVHVDSPRISLCVLCVLRGEELLRSSIPPWWRSFLTSSQSMLQASAAARIECVPAGDEVVGAPGQDRHFRNVVCRRMISGCRPGVVAKER
jgi:hypothetical protein